MIRLYMKANKRGELWCLHCSFALTSSEEYAEEREDQNAAENEQGVGCTALGRSGQNKGVTLVRVATLGALLAGKKFRTVTISR